MYSVKLTAVKPVQDQIFCDKKEILFITDFPFYWEVNTYDILFWNKRF